MNIERIEQIIAWLENGAIHVDAHGNRYSFDMDYWNLNFEEESLVPPEDFPSDCGTAMCIGGAAEQFFGTEGGKREVAQKELSSVDEKHAAHLLGLDFDLAMELFYPWDENWYLEAGRPQLTPEYMAGVLRRLLDTGELIG